MKSIQLKFRYYVTLLLLGMFSFFGAQAQADQPTDAELQALKESPQTQALLDYLHNEGYAGETIIDESLVAVEYPVDDASLKRSAVNKSFLYANERQFTATWQLKNSTTGEEAFVTATGLRHTDGTVTTEADGENQKFTLGFVSGFIKLFPKISNLARKFDECWRQIGAAAIQNCGSCYNCLRNAIVNSSPNWLKIVRSLRCAPSCIRCVGNIRDFVRCVTR